MSSSKTRLSSRPLHLPLLAAVAATAAALSACGSSPTREQLVKEQARVEELRAEAQERELHRQQALAEQTLSAVPAWALAVQPPDATGVYAVGMAEAADYRIALSKAKLDAEFHLAQAVGQEISGSERSYTRDDGSRASGTQQYLSLIDKLVTQVPVVGFDTVKQEIKPSQGTFHAFVMLKLPYAEFNKVVQSERSKTRDATVAAAFDDLAKRVEQRRQQRRQEQPAVTASTPRGLTASSAGDSGGKPADTGVQ